MLAKAMLLGLVPFTSDPNAVSAPYAHDRVILALSLIAGVIGAFAALEAAGRCRGRRGSARAFWLVVAGMLMGAAVWSTHWIGLLAFESPLLHGYDAPLAALSAVIGMGLGGFSFLISWDGAPGRLILAGIIGGVGAIAMHYIGMSGLIIEAKVSYRPVWFALSAAAAVIAITIGYWLAHALDDTRLRAALALPIGAVAAGLHYFDVGAMLIAPAPHFERAETPPALAMALISLAAMVVLWGAVLAAVLRDRRRRAAAASDPARDDYVVVIPTPDSQPRRPL